MVWAAVSSSGPLQAKLDFWEYFDTCYDALGTTENGAECQRVYTEAFLAAEEMLQNAETAVDLLSIMNICDPAEFDFDNQLDLWSFGSYFAGVVAGTVQYNDISSYTIDDICDTLTDPLKGDPLDRYAIVTQEIYGGGCTSSDSISYDSFLRDISDPQLSSHDFWRQWWYQTCREFGWYPTSNNPGGQQGLTNINPVDLDLQYCYDAYGDTFTSEDELQVH